MSPQDRITLKRQLARSCIMKLPDTLRVAGYEVDIVKWDAVAAGAGNSYGTFTSAKLEIGICQDLPNPMKAAYTFLHEVMHAVWFVYGILENDEEERVVTLMSLGWTAVHADNPWLSGWIQDTLSANDSIKQEYVSYNAITGERDIVKSTLLPMADFATGKNDAPNA